MQHPVSRRVISLLLTLAMLVSLCIPALAVDSGEDSTLSIGVLSDPHYFPTQYNGTRGEDYQNQISGDLRLMGEGEALTTGAVDQMIADGDLPQVLLVTGDLSSEGEKASHKGFAQQMARLQAEGVTVLVIPGNHDLYNSSAMTFESDTQIKDNGSGSLWTTEADFRTIYASMGYDEAATVAASNGTLASIEYYVENLGDDGIADCQGGLSYLAVTNSGYAFLMLDTEIYTADFNGKGQAWGNGEGMISDDLLAWIQAELEKCRQAGLTVIAGMHHPLLVHNTTSETEFITDRVQIQRGESGYTADVNNTLVKTLADAGLRWVFTGHMHENDIASYTTASGNTIYDMETGGLVAYPAPYRMVTVTRTADGDQMEETLEVSSVSVKEAAMNACLDAPNGNVTNTEKVDVAQYMTDAMYGDQFPVKLIHRYVDRYLDQLADVPGAMENIAGLDLYETLFNALPGILSDEMVVDLGGSIGELTITYSSEGTVDNWGEGDGVHLNPTSGVAGILGSFTVRNSDIKTEVASVLDQFEAKYIVGGELDARLDQLIMDAVNTVVVDESGHTLEDLIRSMFQRHNSGEDVLPLEPWQAEGLAVLADGALLQERVMEIIQGTPEDVYPQDVSLYGFINDVTNSLTVDLDTLFGRNVLWFNAVKAVFGSETPTVATLLNQFGVDIEEILNGLINEYLSDSFFTSVGGVVDNMISGFAVDEDGLDDVVDGAPAVLTYTGEAVQNPSVENGTLPYQITVSLDTDSPETGRTFSWYTGTDITEGAVQLVPADGISNAQQAEETMDSGSGITEVPAYSEQVQKAKVKLNLILVTTYEIIDAQRHTATVQLEAGQDYWYRVGTSSDAYGQLWSEPVLLQGDGSEEGFTFINVADSQGSTESDYAHYNSALAQAQDTFSDAAFVTHLGDLVDDGINENYWTWVLDTDEMQSMPVIPVAGNHEARSEKGDLPNAIRAHYNLNIPEQDDSTGLYYSYQYKNATFIVLNTNDGDGAVSQAQMDWAAGVAEAADTDWLILLTHKAPYSKGPHGDESDVLALRDALDQFCAQYDVDLVLSGHDHTYLRTPFLSNGEEVDNSSNTTTIQKDGITYQQTTNPSGTVFVIPSTTGVKYYEFDSSVNFGFESEKEGQPYQSVYSGIEIEGDSLYYTAYTEDGQVYDSFSFCKSDEAAKTPAQLVVEQINALPATITLNDKADVEAARAAYDLLSAEEQAQVTNLSVLEQAEEMIAMLETGNAGRTVTVSNGTELRNALNDAGVSKIILNGTCTFGGYDKNWLGQQINTKDGNWAYTINHNVTIEGQGNVWERCILTITNGATVVLKDVDFKSQEGGKSGSITPINLINIQNGTLITQGSTSIQQTLTNGASFKGTSSGNATDSGHAIVIPKGSTGAVYLNGTGLVHGSREAVYTGNAGNTIAVAGSTVNTDQDNIQAIYSAGDITITSGNVQSVHNVGELTMTGGSIHNAQTQASAINAQGDVYLSGGTIQSDANVCLWTDWTGDSGWDEKPAIYVGGTAQLIGQNGVTVSALNLTSANSLDMAVDTTGLYVAQDHQSAAGIYAINRVPATLKELAANESGKLTTNLTLNTDDNSGRGYTLTDNRMTAQLTKTGVQQVYAKLRVVYGGKLTDVAATGNIVGGGAWCNLWLLSPVQQYNNVPVSQVQVKTDVPVMAEGQTLALKSSTFPYTALNNQLTWESSDDEIATVNQDGVVTAHQAGTVTITATAPSGVSDSIALTCVNLAIRGDDSFGENDTQKTYDLTTGLEELPEGITVSWSVSGSGAYLTGSTLHRNTQAGGTVELTAALLYNGKSTGLTASKTITFEKVRDALTVSAQTADGEAIASGVKTNQDVTITVTGDSGKEICYQVDGGEWKTYTGSIAVTVADGERANSTYTFAYADQQEQTDKHACFDVDISKVIPAIPGIANGGELPVNENAQHINSITLPDGITATVDGVPYASGSDIPGGSHTLVLSDAYGNTSTLTVTVPQYTVCWEAATGGTIAVAQALNRMTLGSEAVFTRGTAITITATPDYGFRLTDLKVNGEAFASGSTTTVMDDLTVTASFAAITDPIVVSATVGGQPYAEGTKTNQDVTMTAALQAGLTGTIEYSTNGSEWSAYTGAITVPAADVVNQNTYQFRIQGHEDMTASFSVDLLKKTPVIAGVTEGGTLEKNTITVPEGYTVFIDGSETPYVSGAELEGGQHTVHIQDAYGNSATVSVTVPYSDGYTMEVKLNEDSYQVGETVTAQIYVRAQNQGASFDTFGFTLNTPAELTLRSLTTPLQGGSVSQNGGSLAYSISSNAPVSVTSAGVHIATATFTVNGFDGESKQVTVGLSGAQIAEADQTLTVPCETVSDTAVLHSTESPDQKPGDGGSSSGGSSSGSSSSGNQTETVKNPDGSTTTTVTKPDGTVTETTKCPDGSSSVTKVDKDGKVEVQVTLPADVVEDADGEAVTLPMPEVEAAAGSDEAPTITVDLPRNTTAKVEIPVRQVTTGTVAVLVHADGSEEVIKNTLTTDNGVTVTLSDGDTVKIVDNSKEFVDVPTSHWGADAVSFVTSRELFNGTSDITFSPAGNMTRAMIVTVLARYDGVDTSTGSTWYEAGAAWAVANGVSDGTNLDGSLTREQLVTMLWRLMGSPVVESDLSGYPDSASVSDWAINAMIWAADTGIITGNGAGALNPQGTATRAEVATMLMRFVANNG